MQNSCLLSSINSHDPRPNHEFIKQVRLKHGYNKKTHQCDHCCIAYSINFSTPMIRVNQQVRFIRKCQAKPTYLLNFLIKLSFLISEIRTIYATQTINHDVFIQKKPGVSRKTQHLCIAIE